jgi:acyl-CoA dehydrogenase
MEELENKAKELKIWNLFMEDFSLVEYGLLYELISRSTIGPELINCDYPNVTVMEVIINVKKR